jgi:signal peptidase I
MPLRQANFYITITHMYIERKEENEEVLDLQHNTPQTLHANTHTNTEKEPSSVWELIKFALLALIIVIPIRVFIAQPFIVSGSSMVPTFTDGEYLIVDELSYRIGTPERGDVVVFHYPLDKSKYFIKRIIALPNEAIEINDHTVTIKNAEHKDGFVLDEPYVKNQASNIIKKTLGPDEYFVMGDNRSASSDSRSWGTVPTDLLTGRALFRVLPLTKIGFMPGEYKQ